MLQAGNDTWSFRCSACGKCCNSAPEMSLPELLHHQHRFVGSLAIRRVPRPRLGDRLGTGPLAPRASDADCRAVSDLADALLHRLPGGPQADDVLLATQAFSPHASDPCPALGVDMRCTIHDDRKPVQCSVVPLDALVPDRLQHVVLADRRTEASYLGADCIVPGTGPGSPLTPLVRRLAVVDAAACEALAHRRRDLVDEKRWWGNAVFGVLRGELFANPAALARVPVGGFLVLAIAPVLVVLSAVSPRCRQRCLEYLDAQTALIDERVRIAVASKRLADRPGTAQLRAFARANVALNAALEKASPEARSCTAGESRAIEAWMGLADPVR
jgi:Fe-S-cluster containining protein